MPPIKKNLRGFIARVTAGHFSDVVVAVTYDLDDSGCHTGFEFYKFVTSLNAPALSIPTGRQATFQEELRVLNQAYFADDAAGPVDERIKRKLSEAYTSGEAITVEPLK